jgi:hypothetical protein
MQIILCPGIPQLKHIEFEACLSMEEKTFRNHILGLLALDHDANFGATLHLMTKQCHADLVDGSYIRF